MIQKMVFTCLMLASSVAALPGGALGTERGDGNADKENQYRTNTGARPKDQKTTDAQFNELLHQEELSFWGAIKTPEDLWDGTTNEPAQKTICDIINGRHEIISLDLLKEALKSPQQEGQALLNSLGGFMNFHHNPKNPLDLQHCIYRDSKPEIPDCKANFNPREDSAAAQYPSAAAQYATWRQFSSIKNIVTLLNNAPTLVNQIAELQLNNTLTLESVLEKINHFNPMTTAPIRIKENKDIPFLVAGMLHDKAKSAPQNSNDVARNMAKVSDDALNIFNVFALFIKK